MAKKRDEMPEDVADVTEAAEPAETVEADDSGPGYKDPNVWLRGLWMLVLGVLFGLAEMLLAAFAVLQFLWLLFASERNKVLADAGDTLAKWLLAVARFQSGASDDKPFPWRRLD